LPRKHKARKIAVFRSEFGPNPAYEIICLSAKCILQMVVPPFEKGGGGGY
jgi:hypothetical protein